MKKLLLFLIVCFATLLTASDEPYYKLRQNYSENVETTGSRQIFLLNEGWQYLEENCSLNELTEFTDWQKINLPHTWNQFDATDNNPGYRRDASWYKKEIKIPKDAKNKILRLYFEGVNISCEVFVNGQKADEHIGGYVGFTIDITPFLKIGQTNELLVKADNSINPNIIPSQKSDFFIFGGITRDVWLQVLPKIFIDRVRVEMPEVIKKRATTTAIIAVQNSNVQKTKVDLKVDLIDPNGKIVTSKNIDRELGTGINTFEVEFEPTKNPQLWSPDNPNLYELKVKMSGEKEDTLNERFGYRWFEFKEHGPFYLNGERLLLRGTHRHEEHAGYGNAMPDKLHRKDIEQIKEIGANFVRLAHYPQDPEIYRACDELGLLVWDELPWCRGGMGGTEWKKNTTKLFEEQILQNYNHPSIILWSVGNELYWQPDFPGGDNPDSLKTMVSQLNDLAHKLDPYRLTTMRKYYDGADITDVFSPSIWAGWYSGVYKTYKQALEKARKKYKGLIHAEYGGSSHVGRHTENPITGEGLVKENEWDEKPNMINIKKISSEGDWSESYIVDLFDWHLMVSEQLDWFPGSAQWAFKDFGTPLRPENAIPYINQKGLVDRAGNPKDAYYVFKSYWNTSSKFCYIESKTWLDRYGKEGQKLPVNVFSNCKKVKLIVNGVDTGVKEKDISKFPASGLSWSVGFKEGKNRLVAVGYSSGKVVTADTLNFTYHTKLPAKAERINLTKQSLENGNILIKAKVVDKKGALVPSYNKRVYFDLNGGGELLKYYGTPTKSDVIEFASGRAAIEFIPENNKRAIIEARTQDFKGDYIVISLTVQN
ncbi:MAG: DUF4982 domain-containing protein [Calditrichaeota bacterium]|nr:MAG: DUF4982 domain-containing protein [Calditrichota bacterium]MBL1205594.1 DUF4982 domain-containing protein [Calditrichota bacterium]NOG45423.1 DUF4982 domain-containing protein [Calditrichota bacterium]